METEFDVIVVGAGPAGSTCASFLAKGNAKVLLLDKAVFPRDKTCGDAISGKSLGILRELGLDKEIESLKHGKVFGVTFSSPNGTIADIPFPKNPKKGKYKREGGKGYAVRREVYDNFLFQKAKKQVSKTIEGFTVTDVIESEGKVIGVKGTDLNKKEREFKAKIVVGADGSTSVIARKLGLNEIDFKHHITALRAYYKNIKGLKGTIEIHFVDSLLPGYFWIFPLENNLANVGVGMITKDIRDKSLDLRQAMFDVIQNHPLFKERFKEAKMVSPVKGWTLPLGSKHRKVHGNGFVLLGDAASLIDPFSGEGIGNAMTSAKIASKVILKALEKKDYSAETLSEYEKNLRNELDAELKTSYMLQKIGRIKFLLNFVIGKAATKKKVSDAISGMLANEEAKKEFISPWFFLKLLFV
jgi:geranylgeranyl reductase family protein